MYTNSHTTFSHIEQFLGQVSEFIVMKRLDACKPLAFSFYLEFSSHEGAQEVTDWLTEEGFSVVMEQKNESNKWLCWCHKTSIPTPLKLEAMASKVLEAVKLRNGMLERWETNPYNSGQELGQLLAAFELQYMQEHGHYA